MVFYMKFTLGIFAGMFILALIQGFQNFGLFSTLKILAIGLIILAIGLITLRWLEKKDLL